MTHISQRREAAVFAFKDTGGWLLPKWTWTWTSHSFKNSLWRNWFWQFARSKKLHLVLSGRCNWLCREKLENSVYKIFLEENENKLVNIKFPQLIEFPKNETFLHSSIDYSNQCYPKKAILMQKFWSWYLMGRHSEWWTTLWTPWYFKV